MDREALAYAVAEILLRHLPGRAEPEAASSIAADLVRLMESPMGGPPEEERRLAVVTVLGRNHAGILHAISEILAKNDVDIVDINQTIVHGNFTMLMIIDPATSQLPFAELKEILRKRGDEVGVQVYCQYEDMMRATNRV